MPTLIVVACGAAKIWKRHPGCGPTAAKDVYIGAPFRVNREYAEKFADRWVILSAKYGFIDPDFVIPADCNVTFKDSSTNPAPVSTLTSQLEGLGLDRFERVVVLGGADYFYAVRAAFAQLDVVVTKPVSGLGTAMAQLKGAIRVGKPLG